MSQTALVEMEKANKHSKHHTSISQKYKKLLVTSTEKRDTDSFSIISEGKTTGVAGLKLEKPVYKRLHICDQYAFDRFTLIEAETWQRVVFL